jgi:hypothetical protein
MAKILGKINCKIKTTIKKNKTKQKLRMGLYIKRNLSYINKKKEWIKLG